ncbi:hypothetical protein ACHAWX_006567 [Stephanocyclus meneghinianus]
MIIIYCLSILLLSIDSSSIMISHQYPQHHDVDVDMQEIEVIDMNGIATTSLSSPSVSSSPPTTPCPSRNPCHAADAKQVFLALLSQETTLPSVTSRHAKITHGTPITTSCQGTTDTNILHNNPTIKNSDRTKMCSWYYEMSTFLKISPSTASRAMSYLDRFMGSESTHAVIASRVRDEYQLVALTALFVAIKLYERLNIMPCHVSYLSRGRYTSEEVIAMEMALLNGLKWKLTSATKLDYADLILDCIRHKLSTNSTDDHALTEIRDLMSLQIQLSDFYSVYSTKRQSMVALAALINAFEVKKNMLLDSDREVFRSTFREFVAYYDRRDVYHTMDKLFRLVDPSSDRRRSTEWNRTGDSNGSTPVSSPDMDKTCEETSLETFDAALDTMEEMNFDTIVSHFLCCGSIPISNPDSAMESNATQMKPKHISSSNCPGDIGNSHSFDTQGSIKFKTPKRESTKQSPVSIATMLFGTGT